MVNLLLSKQGAWLARCGDKIILRIIQLAELSKFTFISTQELEPESYVILIIYNINGLAYDTCYNACMHIE